MSVTSVINTSASTSTSSSKSGFAALGQADFLKLLTTQLQMQDPSDPVDNKEMLAQMAQFSQLGGISEMSTTLSAIASKLDALIAQQSSTGTETASTDTQA
ncbi:flagellar hook capping FlgD N-terminal domain-containing protein [Tsuneonella sp. CC-YZS046]|uniref:flagellar hook assembly protein FlgD n=1 Tax=Tsuneonella sp. CC-YZS046 TaxID=3042152 RepID=UPI002D76FDDB|nr:flagellar hook capping FlgD N-terminal domain-containing protein [Tsuneonella sp. CC-YZS046]WRO66808.1 flagellar hook capping FlgD N-terminal domain-containing protein [Tsuneonella sp. CC-YZS046]